MPSFLTWVSAQSWYSERIAAITHLWLQGLTMHAIGDVVGVSESYASQIIMRLRSEALACAVSVGDRGGPPGTRAHSGLSGFLASMYITKSGPGDTVIGTDEPSTPPG